MPPKAAPVSSPSYGTMFLFIGIFLLTLALLVTAGVFTIKSAINIKRNSAYESDTTLQKAHKYLTIASILAWISVALVVILIGLYLFFGWETAAYTGSWISMGLMGFTALLSLIVGILAAIAASSMRKSSNWHNTGDDHQAYIDGIIAASVGIGGVGILVIAFIIYFVVRSQHKAKQEAALKLVHQKEAEAHRVALQSRANIGAIKLEERVEAAKERILQEKAQQVALAQQIAAQSKTLGAAAGATPLGGKAPSSH